MGFLGELGAGLGFLSVGLWQAYVSVKAYRLSGAYTSNNRNPGFARYGMHVAVALFAVLHMIFGLISTKTNNNGSGVGAAFALERFGVAAVFFLYAAVALISECTNALPLPAGMVGLLAVWAFGEEFSLFYLTGGDEHELGLETQYYSLLLVPIGVCLLATVTEMAIPAAILPRLVQSVALILQGTWFFQMAASLYSTKLMAQGCQLIQQSEGVDTVSCDGMSLMRGRALATLQFNCHLALLLLTLLPIYGLLGKIHSVPQHYERLSGEGQVPEVARGLDNGRQTGVELTPADYFHVLGEDEEIEEEEEEEEEGETELKEELPDTNGFHRVAI